MLLFFLTECRKAQKMLEGGKSTEKSFAFS